MSDHLVPHEKAAFLVLSAVLAGAGGVERDSLRVLVASRGGELGRDYIRLRDLGLVEEAEVRPGFLRRLFGAKAKRVVRLTQRGLALAAELGAVAPEAAVAAEAEAVPPVAVAAGEGLPVVEVALPVEAVAAEVAAEPVVEEVPPAPEVVEPVAEVAPPAEAEAVPVVAAPPVRRFTPADFTEAVGGVPLDDAPAVPEGDRLEGLEELLGLLGFELMPAGRLLAASRWAEGFADADVALEVLVVSVAHAARLDRTGTARLEGEAMLALVDAIAATLAPLVAEGELTAAQLEESVETMRLFVGGGEAAEPALGALLDDPLRGLAPPAICPEGVWVPADDGGE